MLTPRVRFLPGLLLALAAAARLAAAATPSPATQPSVQTLKLPAQERIGTGRIVNRAEKPGVHMIEARHAGFRRTVRSVEVRAGDNSLDLTLESGASLSGRVVDANGNPVASARVFPRLPDGSSLDLPEGNSEPDGSFTLSGLADGTYRLRAEKEGFAAG